MKSTVQLVLLNLESSSNDSNNGRETDETCSSRSPASSLDLSPISTLRDGGFQHGDPNDDDALQRVLSHLASVAPCLSARDYISNTDSLKPLLACCYSYWAKVQTDILKFIQRKDRYLALASVLFKSRAFHETFHEHGIRRSGSSDSGSSNCNNSSISSNSSRPVVDLPRTEHNKPFIPLVTFTPATTISHEQTLYPISLSHQFPFAGLARLVVPVAASPLKKVEMDEPQSAMPTPRQAVLVGMDIVVFDAVNVKLYDTVLDFCEAFRGSFSAREYEAIVHSARHKRHDEDNGGDENDVDNDTIMLRELYLRWTMKEAYTKALGTGMGCDFSSFETVLNVVSSSSSRSSPVDSSNGSSPDDSSNGSIWQWMSQSVHHGGDNTSPRFLQSLGQVVHTGPPSSRAHANAQMPSEPETWHFTFIPLTDESLSPDKDGGTVRAPIDSIRGCACVCVGPLPKMEQQEYAVQIDTEWTSLAGLIAWHGVS